MAALTLKQALAQFWLQITNKFVPRESGKGLSTNDYSNADKQKLNSLPATVGTITGVTAGNGLSGGGTSGAITLAAQVDRGLSIASDKIGHSNSVTAGTASEGGSARTLAFGGTFNVPSVTYDAQGHISSKGSTTLTMPAKPTYNNATQSAAGLMSAADKAKLDGVANNANNYTYTLPNASSSTLGGVKIGSNISVSSGTISLSKANVVAALGYTPPTTDTNTTYSAGTGISISDTTISNSGVRSISSGSTEGTISVNTNGTVANVAVAGLGSAAYTNANNYAQASSLSNYLPLAGGALSGRTYSGVTVDTEDSSFRNIRIISPNVEVIAGETEIPTGEIWLRYEEEEVN